MLGVGGNGDGGGSCDDDSHIVQMDAPVTLDRLFTSDELGGSRTDFRLCS